MRPGGLAQPVPALRIAEQVGDRGGEPVDAEVVHEHTRLARDDDAAAGARAGGDDRNAARRGLDHRAAQLGAARRSDDEVRCLVQVGRVLREGHEPHDIREPELPD